MAGNYLNVVAPDGTKMPGCTANRKDVDSWLESAKYYFETAFYGAANVDPTMLTNEQLKQLYGSCGELQSNLAREWVSRMGDDVPINDPHPAADDDAVDGVDAIDETH